MTFLLTTHPNWLLPVFQQTGFILEYKRFPSDYMWRPFLDLSELSVDLTDINTAISTLEGQVADHETRIDTAQAAADAAAATAAAAAVGYPSGHTLSPYALEAVSGGFAPPVFSNTSWLSHYCLINGLNAEAKIRLPFEAGNWSIHMMGVKHSTAGDITCYFDGVSLGFVGAYAAANALFVFSWVVNSVVAGMHEVSFKVTGHQPSSTGYTQYASQIIMRKN